MSIEERLTNLAKDLIDIVEGINDERTIKGVVEVFKGILEGADKGWEDHIRKETEEMLMYNEILCSCGKLIQISSTRQQSTVDIYNEGV